jgi:predicted ATPase/DNA-binding SARP family transcriptional activator
MARLILSLLGGFVAAVDGTPVAGLDTDKTRALLAYLGIEAAQPHSREALAGLLWPELPDEAARRNLRNSLFKLRQALGEDDRAAGFLLVTAKTVQLDPHADWEVDVERFTRLLAACRAHRHRHQERCATCHARRAQAAELYRGDLLRGFYLDDCAAFEEWLLLTRERLHQAMVQVLADLAAYHARRGESALALEYTLRQLALEPWREEATRQAMRLLAARGDRSGALAQYAACRKVLAEELNAEPSAATTALYGHLKAQPPDAEPPPDGTRPPALPLAPNLPRQLTPFVGREEELRLLIERLDSPDTCLLTVVGPGGVGKTRLAQRAAWEQVGAFADGVYWIPLAAVSSPALLASSIAQSIGFQFEAAEDPQSQLLTYLREKELLLVFDNFEQLLSAEPEPAPGRNGGTSTDATDLLLAILKSAPRISILVTSRERLGLQAEWLLDLSGLPLPAGEDGRYIDPSPAQDPSASSPAADHLTHLMKSSAVQLFVERAQHAHADFALSAENAQDVVEVCRLVRGLPLGIVLAAAWVRYYSLARIARSIRDNLDFLSSAARDAAPQHSSLRAVFNHSWNLLAEEEQRVFRQLAVFRGGWEEEAAERVVGASIHSLVSLVDKSLLRRDAGGRFEIHEVLRQYATEKLDERPAEQDAVRRRHAEYYLDLAQLAKAELQGTEQVKWLARLDQEHDNLRAVLKWAVDTGDADLGVQLGGALWRFWYVRGYNSEGRAHLAAVLALPPSPPRATPDEPGAHLPATATPARTAESIRGRTGALNGAGVLASVQGEHGKARLLYEESLALSRELGDKQGIAASLNNLGIMAYQLGDAEAGRAMHEESLAVRREFGDTQGVAASLNNLGIIAQAQGDYPLAQVRHEEALALRRELGDTLGIASSLGNLGVIAQEQGEYAAARVLFEESLAIRREVGDKTGMAELFSNLGVVARQQGDYAAAQALYEQCLTLSREAGYTWSIALVLSNLGVVAQDRGDYEQARALHRESLILRRDLGEKVGVAGSLACIGAVLTGSARSELERSPHDRQEQRGQLERAARLFGAVDTLLESLLTILPTEDRQLYMQNLALVQSLLDEEAFTQAWSAGRALSMDQAINYALEG